MEPLFAVDLTTSLQQALDSLFKFIPNLIGFLVILIVGYFIARLVKSVIARVLDKVGLDDHLHSGQTGEYVERVSPGASPSRRALRSRAQLTRASTPSAASTTCVASPGSSISSMAWWPRMARSCTFLTAD